MMKETIFFFFFDAASKKDQVIDENTDLFETNILDSMEIIVFLTFLQETCGIEFSLGDLDFENYQSVNTIMNWIEGQVKR